MQQVHRIKALGILVIFACLGGCGDNAIHLDQEATITEVWFANNGDLLISRQASSTQTQTPFTHLQRYNLVDQTYTWNFSGEYRLITYSENSHFALLAQSSAASSENPHTKLRLLNLQTSQLTSFEAKLNTQQESDIFDQQNTDIAVSNDGVNIALFNGKDLFVISSDHTKAVFRYTINSEISGPKTAVIKFDLASHYISLNINANHADEQRYDHLYIFQKNKEKWKKHTDFQAYRFKWTSRGLYAFTNEGLQYWNPAISQLTPLTYLPAGQYSVYFSEDGRYALYSKFEDLQIHDLVTESLLLKLNTERVSDLSFGDGEILLFQEYKGALSRISLGTGELAALVSWGNKVSKDNTRIAGSYTYRLGPKGEYVYKRLLNKNEQDEHLIYRIKDLL